MDTAGACHVRRDYQPVRIEDVSDLDWYIDHVVVPSGPQRRQVGPVRAWRAWWDALAYRLDIAADATAAGDAVRLALTQGFVLTRADIRRCGVPDAQLRRLVRHGEWLRVDHGCYAIAAMTGDDPRLSRRRRHALQAAAAATKRAHHVVAGASAAILAGLPVLAVPDRPELVGGPGATSGRLERARVSRRSFGDEDTGLWFGTPVTRTPRSVVDLARADPRSGLMAADAALHEGVLSLHELGAALGRQARLTGMRRAREVLALADPRIESPLESLTHLALHGSGFPAPVAQHWVTGADGRRYRLDFLWPQFRLALEADGRAKYTDAERWREKRRDLALTRTGLYVARVTWRDVFSDWPTVERWLRELMRTRQSQEPESRP